MRTAFPVLAVAGSMTIACGDRTGGGGTSVEGGGGEGGRITEGGGGNGGTTTDGGGGEGGAPPLCPNGTIDAGEDCDGTALGDTDCTTLGFSGGDLGCNNDCTFD